MVQHNFGYETAGGSLQNLWNIIAGSVFACTEAGTADSITAYIGVGSSPTGGHDTYVKCAIYDSSLNLVGSSAQVLLPKATTGWRTFNFSDPKPSLSIANYWLVAWAEFPHATFSTWLYYNAGDANQGLTKATTYNGFPNPLVTPTYSSNKYSIYCTYTVTGGGVTVKKGSNLAATMTEMLNSKMLFSACNRFPKLAPRHI